MKKPHVVPSGHTCAACRYFEVFEDGVVGHCRRYPPPEAGGMDIDTLDYIESRWPIVSNEDWCGEWTEAGEGA